MVLFFLHSVVYFQVVAHGFQSAYIACSIYTERKRPTCCFSADGAKDDNPLWSPYQLLTCGDDSKHRAQHSVHISMQSSNEMLKFSQQSLKSALDHNAMVLCICNIYQFTVMTCHMLIIIVPRLLIWNWNSYTFHFVCCYMTNCSHKYKPLFISTIVALFSMQSVLGSAPSLTDGF